MLALGLFILEEVEDGSDPRTTEITLQGPFKLDRILERDPRSIIGKFDSHRAEIYFIRVILVFIGQGISNGYQTFLSVLQFAPAYFNFLLLRLKDLDAFLLLSQAAGAEDDVQDDD